MSDLGTTPRRARREFPKAVRLAAWERCKGHCEGCTAKLFPGRFEFDHDIPDWLGGEPTLENCVVLCDPCHRSKTATVDIPRIAKAKRVRDAHLGIRKAKRPMPGSRQSKWKRKISGETVAR